MFNFIRGIFDNSATTSDMTWNVPVFNYEYEYEGSGVDSPYLSQAELQMLQRIVSELLRYENSDSKLMKYAASKSEKGTKQRDYYFKEHRKSKVKIKKLSALQYRLKHKIAARG